MIACIKNNKLSDSSDSNDSDILKTIITISNYWEQGKKDTE